MTIRFDDKIVIITGAGNGLGREHALAFAARGAKVVVNDLGGACDGSGSSISAAQSVVDEIVAAGGQAIANGANVADFDQVQEMVAQAKDAFGGVHILINNAGILRDKSFAKMTAEDFRAVIDVHLIGAFNCSKAVWEGMRAQQYGRIVMTTSASGLYGNFGQTNYGAAKLGQIGMMNTLYMEGAKYNIKVNAVSPLAATRMTADLAPQPVLDLLMPEAITPAVLYLASEGAPTKTILAAGAGVFAKASIVQTGGVFIPPDTRTPEEVEAQMAGISSVDGQIAYSKGNDQDVNFLTKAAKALGLSLGG